VKVKHAVWPTSAPPVCTAYWDQESWDKFAAGFRPEGYEGGMHDQVAYDQWLAERRASQDVPSRNIDWAALVKRHSGLDAPKPEIELRAVGINSLYIYYQGGLPYAVVFWGGQDASQAQSYLDRHAFIRCGHTGCGVRLGRDAQLGDHCPNH